MTLDGILVAMQYSASQPSAGWYPDPAGSGDERYWDGATWSSVTRPNSRPAAQSSYGNAPGRSQDRSRYAGWWSRCAATLLDALVLAIPSQRTPGLWRSIIRAVGVEVIGLIGRAVVFLPVVSYLMPLFTQKKQTVHDMMAGTIVVKK